MSVAQQDGGLREIRQPSMERREGERRMEGGKEWRERSRGRRRRERKGNKEGREKKREKSREVN